MPATRGPHSPKKDRLWVGRVDGNPPLQFLSVRSTSSPALACRARSTRRGQSRSAGNTRKVLVCSGLGQLRTANCRRSRLPRLAVGVPWTNCLKKEPKRNSISSLSKSLALDLCTQCCRANFTSATVEMSDGCPAPRRSKPTSQTTSVVRGLVPLQRSLTIQMTVIANLVRSERS